MRRRPLDRHIAPIHDPALPGVQHELDLALQHNAIVQADGPVHGRHGARRKIDVSEDCPAGDHDARFLLQVLFVVAQVVVGVEFHGEVVRRVAEGEVLDAADVLPLEGFFVGGGEDGFACGVVVGDEAFDGWEPVWERFCFAHGEVLACSKLTRSGDSAVALLLRILINVPSVRLILFVNSIWDLHRGEIIWEFCRQGTRAGCICGVGHPTEYGEIACTAWRARKYASGTKEKL
jgi:hypothetical protein